jgi:DNA-binding CsgD family transcriptional regulator
MQEQAVWSVVEAAYASAVAPGAERDMLLGLAGLFRCHFADAFARTDDHAVRTGMAVGLDARDYEDEMLGRWSKRNVWGQKHPVRIAGEIVTTRDMVTKEELVASEMYNEYLAPRGLHEGLRLSTWAGGGWIQDISLLRSWSGGPFDRRELVLAERLLPHLRRSVAVARRLRWAATEAEAGLAAMDATRHAVFLLDRAGIVRRMNRAAETMVAQADGLTATRAGLVPPDRSQAHSFAAMLAAAAGEGRRRPVSGHMRLKREGRAPLSVIAQPLGRAEDWPLPNPPGVLLIVTDPECLDAAREAQLRARFGFTAMEAGIAVDLLAGRDIAEIAAQRGRGVATIRTHVARAMVKTGATRQAELLRVLLRLPPPE